MNPVSAILKPREVAAATYASAAGCVQEIGPEQAFIGKLSAGRFSPERIGSVKNAAYHFNSRDNAV